MTGPQLCGPRVPDIHALEAVSRNPAALRDGVDLLLLLPLSLSLPPVPVPWPFPTSLLQSHTPTPTRGDSGISGFLFNDISLTAGHSLSGLRGIAHGEHMSAGTQRATAPKPTTGDPGKLQGPGETPIQTRYLPRLCPV